MIRRPPRSTRTDTLSLHDALPISAAIEPRPAFERGIGVVGREAGPVIIDGKHDTRAFGRAPKAHATAGVARGIFGRRSQQFGQVFGAERQPQCIIERSEEHTSELQSIMRISYAVFCLKKKKQ